MDTDSRSLGGYMGEVAAKGVSLVTIWHVDCPQSVKIEKSMKADVYRFHVSPL